MDGLPQRTCLGCGAKKPKFELFRLVLSSEGQLRVDPHQLGAGRGAYLCGKGCLAAAIKRRAFVRAFRGRGAGRVAVPGWEGLVGLEAALGQAGESSGEKKQPLG